MISVKKKIGYLIPMFPDVLLTFETQEMLALIQKNIEVYVFSLRTWHGKAHSRYAEAFLSNTFQSPYILSLALIQAQIHFLWRKPKIYFSILLDLLKTNWKNPFVLLRSIAIFPKSVLFAKKGGKIGLEHIHAHYAHLPTTAAMIVWRLTGIPFSCTAHNSDIVQYPPVDLEERINFATPFITISEFWKKYLIGRFGEYVGPKIKVVHCGINLKEFQPAHSEPFEPIKILTVARLEPIKGIKYLIEACELLNQKGVRCRCSIVGDGSERRKLEELVRQKGLESLVTFHGAIFPENVLSFYREADIFVLPSFREGIPVSAMEAMAMEIPVVSTNVYGIPELVENGHSGILVEPGDAQKIAHAIEILYRDRNLREKMGKAGRMKVDREFNIEKNAEILISLFFGKEDIC